MKDWAIAIFFFLASGFLLGMGKLPYKTLEVTNKLLTLTYQEKLEKMEQKK